MHNAAVTADPTAPPLSGEPERHDVPEGGRSGFVIVEGSQVHYLEWGRADRPVVLALHGGGQTAYMFEELGKALRETHHVIAPDLPGHGDSDSPPDLAMNMNRHAVARTMPPLLAEFGVDRVAIVGASFGGMTAITLAVLEPQLVAAIVLVDVGHRLEEAGVQRIIAFMRKHESFASLDEAAEAIAEYAPRRSVARTTSLSRNLRRRPDGRWIWKHGFGRMHGSQAAPPLDQDWREVLTGLDDDARLVTAPALVIRGGESDVLSDEGAHDVGSLLPDSRVVVVPDAGHLTAGDNPEGTVQQITSFFTEIRW
jgi:pimeloyl-ACP methyl ester carboxylesterase